MALIISWGGPFAIFALVVLAAFVIFRTHAIHKKQNSEETEIKDIEIEEVNGEILAEKVLEKCKASVSDTLEKVSALYGKTIHDFEAEDRKGLKNISKDIAHLNKKTKKLKDNVYSTVRKLQEQSIDSSLYYVQVLDYLRETAHCLTFIADPCFQHLDNNHKVFKPEQFEDLNNLKVVVIDLLHTVTEMITSGDYAGIDQLLEKQQGVLETIRLNRKAQLKRIKNDKAGTKISMLYLNILHETQNMLLHLINLAKAQRDFVDYQSK